jgi:predicted transcriptional regulator
MAQISKDYAREVIKDYALIMESIPAIIKESGYKVGFISKRLNIPYSSFYAKRKQKSFTYKEVAAIVDLLPEEEDHYWTERARIRMADPEMATREEIFKILDAE